MSETEPFPCGQSATQAVVWLAIALLGHGTWRQLARQQTSFGSPGRNIISIYFRGVVITLAVTDVLTTECAGVLGRQ